MSRTQKQDSSQRNLTSRSHFSKTTSTKNKEYTATPLRFIMESVPINTPHHGGHPHDISSELHLSMLIARIDFCNFYSRETRSIWSTFSAACLIPSVPPFWETLFTFKAGDQEITWTLYNLTKIHALQLFDMRRHPSSVHQIFLHAHKSSKHISVQSGWLLNEYLWIFFLMHAIMSIMIISKNYCEALILY